MSDQTADLETIAEAIERIYELASAPSHHEPYGRLDAIEREINALRRHLKIMRGIPVFEKGDLVAWDKEPVIIADEPVRVDDHWEYRVMNRNLEGIVKESDLKPFWLTGIDLA